jgi:hypothetical protein
MKDTKDTALFSVYEEFEPHDESWAERSLLRAILETALSDLEREGELAEKAKEFLLSEENDYLFSFRSICSYLQVDPERVLIVTGLRRPK